MFEFTDFAIIELTTPNGGCTDTVRLASEAPEFASTKKNCVPFVTQFPVGVEPEDGRDPVIALPVGEVKRMTTLE